MKATIEIKSLDIAPGDYFITKQDSNRLVYQLVINDLFLPPSTKKVYGAIVGLMEEGSYRRAYSLGLIEIIAIENILAVVELKEIRNGVMVFTLKN